MAIVGRPNVGKSALFNRLAGRQISIVHDQPGITRDRIVAECRPGRGGIEPFEIIDTGGIGQKVDGTFSDRVHAEADIALQTAALVLFVVDGRAGLTAVDDDLARRLRRGDRPVFLVVNKIDEDMHIPLEGEFARLGFAETFGVSAAHGRGIGELIEAVVGQDRPGRGGKRPTRTTTTALPPTPNRARRAWRWSAARMWAKVRSPMRSWVSSARLSVTFSGTTRDAVDIPCRFNEKDYVLIDTAGIRHRGKRDNSAEIFSVMRSEESIRRAHLCVLVIDASAGVTAQDRQIAGLIQKANKPVHCRGQQVGSPRRRRRIRARACGSSARRGWTTRGRSCFSCRSRRWWRFRP